MYKKQITDLEEELKILDKHLKSRTIGASIFKRIELLTKINALKEEQAVYEFESRIKG